MRQLHMWGAAGPTTISPIVWLLTLPNSRAPPPLSFLHTRQPSGAFPDLPSARRLSGVPAFVVGFILTPLASNSSEVVSSLRFAAKKRRKNMNLTLSQVRLDGGGGARLGKNSSSLLVWFACCSLLVWFASLSSASIPVGCI